MTIGISKETLERLRNLSYQDREVVKTLSWLINTHCKELNQWLPIDENTPKDRQIKIYDAGYGQVVVQWNAYFRCFTDPRGGKYLNPSHYQELPEDPIMPIHKPELPR